MNEFNACNMTALGTLAEPCRRDRIRISRLAAGLLAAARAAVVVACCLAWGWSAWAEESPRPKAEAAKVSTTPGGAATQPAASPDSPPPVPPSGSPTTKSAETPVPSSPPPPVPSPLPSVAPAKSLQESGPPLYYLKDKEGNLQPVPGFRFEDFEQMFREKLNRGAMPRYRLQALKIEGTVKAALAEAKVTFRILVRDEDWVRVPLRLDQAILRGPAQYKGPGQHLLHFENEGGGYVAWIRGAAGQEHQLTLDLLVPLSTIGDETTLKLHAPRATESELKLTVPTAGAVGEVSEALRF